MSSFRGCGFQRTLAQCTVLEREQEWRPAGSRRPYWTGPLCICSIYPSVLLTVTTPQRIDILLEPRDNNIPIQPNIRITQTPKHPKSSLSQSFAYFIVYTECSSECRCILHVVYLLYFATPHSESWPPVRGRWWRWWRRRRWRQSRPSRLPSHSDHDDINFRTKSEGRRSSRIKPTHTHIHTQDLSDNNGRKDDTTFVRQPLILLKYI